MARVGKCVGACVYMRYLVIPVQRFPQASTFDYVGFQNLCHSYACLQRYTFNSYDRKVLAMQPTHVLMHFPALLTHRSGVDTKLVALMRILLLKKVSFNGMRDTVSQLHHLRHCTRQAQYYSKLLFFKEGREKDNTPPAWWAPMYDWASVLDKDPFPSYPESNGLIPSGKCLCFYCLCLLLELYSRKTAAQFFCFFSYP